MSILDRDRALINKALKKYLSALKGPRVLTKAMSYAVLVGGKRLRPLLVLESARALGCDVKEAMPFASAIEFVHNFSLVHDDLPVMDNDDTRRGKPTCHKKFGENIAILAGDALLNLAYGVLSGTKNTKTREIASRISEAVGSEHMIGGQVLDLGFVRRASKRKIDNMKTAALMAVSCEAGALAANSSEANVKRMRLFGEKLGLAFQIGDDIEDSDLDTRLLNRMKKEAARYICEAEEEIFPFGRKALGLKIIAEKVLKKIHK